MANEMFNFDTIRQILLDDIASGSEWQESDESDEEMLLDLDEFENSESCSQVKIPSVSTQVWKVDNVSDNNNYLSRDDATKWRKFSTESISQDHSELLFETAGPSASASKAITMDECFLLFMNNDILELISDSTNFYITSIRHHYSRDRDCTETNSEEIKTLIGLLLLTSLYKSKNQNFDELWEKDGLGVDVFRLAMNLNRFKFLLRCMRFEKSNNGISKEKINSLAAISNLFDLFIGNCRKNFTAGSDITLFDQIVEYKGDCPSYEAAGPESPRFGMKIHTLADTCFNYILNMNIFIRDQKHKSKDHSNNADTYVKHLTEGFECNLLLMDNVASFSLMNSLLLSNITSIGKLSAFESEIPDDFLNFSSENQTQYFHDSNNFIISIRPDDKKKNIVLLSTTRDIQTHNTHTKKLTDECYINAAHSTESLKKFFSKNSISRRTRRFSLRIWFHLLDVAILNSFIIYSINNNSRILRRNFLKQLGLSFVNKAIKNKAMNKHLPRELREEAAQFSGTGSFCPKLLEKTDNKPKRCSMCPRLKDIKVRTSCCSCKFPMCKKHMESICPKCLVLSTHEEN